MIIIFFVYKFILLKTYYIIRLVILVIKNEFIRKAGKINNNYLND